MDYRINDRELAFAMESLWKDAQRNGHDEDTLTETLGIDFDTMVAVISEAAKFAETELAPLNQKGDEQGASLRDGVVTLPDGWQAASDKYAEAGWAGLTAPEAFGGQALPQLLNTSVAEMTQAANMAFGLMPLLSSGVIEVLADFGNDFHKEHYLKSLITGEFSGTMNLTEPNAGSDLRLIRTKAVATDELHNEQKVYRIKGQKIYITYGEHSLTKNIVHLVLAKIEGNDNISLFLVPKMLPNGDANAVKCLKLEEKMGIHASPTCVMMYGGDAPGHEDGALGFLIGDADKGLQLMFKMMNNARHAVGVQGLALSSRSFHAALAYAKERKQGRSSIKSDKDEPVAIINHPDVQRMLLVMESSVFAMRALCYGHAWKMDNLMLIDDEAKVKQNQLIELLTPIVKGWCTEISNEITSIGIQVHGGMGFVEETGVAQHYRDARITSIYEGTTGIQAMDLAFRKLIRDDGIAMQSAIDEMLELVNRLEKHAVDNEGSIFVICRKFRDAVDDLEHTTEWILENKKNVPLISAVSFDYLMLCGYVFGAWQLNKQALLAYEQKKDKLIDDKLANKFIYLAEYFGAQMLTRVMSHENIIMRGAGCAKHIVADLYDLEDLTDKAKKEVEVA